MIVFLDANIEVNDGWLEPLLSRIASDRSVVTIPHIDHLNSYNMSYQELNQTLVYGFGWNLYHDEYVKFSNVEKFNKAENIKFDKSIDMGKSCS